jgi:DNA-binding IclR family transcriptional regulator
VSKTLLNRLAMFEVLDRYGPLTITELAQRAGLDVTVVSRTVSACEPEGWLIRLEGRIALGPRCTLLGHSGPIADVINRGAPLVHAVAGVTGLLTHAYGLVGANAALIAVAAGREPISTVPAGLAVQAPLFATAAGRAIAAQLDEDRLGALLPADPFPDAAAIIARMADISAQVLPEQLAPPGPATPARAAGLAGRPLPRDRAELRDQLDDVRRERAAVDAGGFYPAISCLAVPWPQTALPAALACLGPADALAAERDLIVRALRAAALPGATPGEVVATAATAYSVPAAHRPRR